MRKPAVDGTRSGFSVCSDTDRLVKTVLDESSQFPASLPFQLSAIRLLINP